jgi:hypothetical protein
MNQLCFQPVSFMFRDLSDEENQAGSFGIGSLCPPLVAFGEGPNVSRPESLPCFTNPPGEGLTGKVDQLPVCFDAKLVKPAKCHETSLLCDVAGTSGCHYSI